MKIFSDTSRNPGAESSGRAARTPRAAADGGHSTAGLPPISLPRRELEHPAHEIPTALELYHSQILRALFMLLACVGWSGCKTSPPPAQQEASALDGTGRYSVIVLPVLIVRSSSADNGSDAPPWYNQGSPETIPFKEPERTVHAHEASKPASPPASHPINAPENLQFHDFNQPAAGFAGVPSAGAQTHSSADEQ